MTLILTGPTATGKTAIALEVARALPGQIEIVNADSMLVYRGMDIGTAKPTSEELREVPHHLVDIRNPEETFTAGEFVRAARRALVDIRSRGKKPLIVGGTGFYLKALLYGLWDAPPAHPGIRARLEKESLTTLWERLEVRDPESARRIGATDRYRLVRALELIELTGRSPTELEAERPQLPDPEFQLFVIDRKTQELEERIRLRVFQMLEQGLVEEVERLRAVHPLARSLGAVGYAETRAHLEGILPSGRKIAPGIAGLQSEIELGTRQLVKRQRTWFRSTLTALRATESPVGESFELERDRALLLQRALTLCSKGSP